MIRWGLLYGLLVGLGFAATVVALGAGCATWSDQCKGDRTKLPCPCPTQQNPGCYPPLNDNMVTSAR